MKTVDLSPLKTNDAEFERIASSVEERFTCEWDDVVHDSFGLYVKQIQERTRAIRTIRCKAETLVKEIEGLKVDELIKKAEYLCKEADTV